MELVLKRIGENGDVVRQYRLPVEKGRPDVSVSLAHSLASDIMFRDAPDPKQWSATLGGQSLDTGELLGDVTELRSAIIEDGDQPKRGFMKAGGGLATEAEAIAHFCPAGG